MLRTATFPRTDAALVLYRVIIDSKDRRLRREMSERHFASLRCEVGDEMAQRDVDEKRPRPRRRRRRRRRIEEREDGRVEGVKSVKVGREWKRISTETGEGRGRPCARISWLDGEGKRKETEASGSRVSAAS